MRPDINAIEERRKRLYKSDADNVYVEDYLADTEFLLNRINDLTTQLAEAKAGYEAAVEDIPHTVHLCAWKDCCDMANAKSTPHDFCMKCCNWTYRGRRAEAEKGEGE